MAAREGFRRITTLGRTTAVTGSLFLLVGFSIQLWGSGFNQQSSPAGLFLGPGYFLLVVGVLLLLVGWIGDGFVTKKDY